jgi:hypothetical protein
MIKIVLMSAFIKRGWISSSRFLHVRDCLFEHII